MMHRHPDRNLVPVDDVMEGDRVVLDDGLYFVHAKSVEARAPHIYQLILENLSKRFIRPLYLREGHPVNVFQGMAQPNPPRRRRRRRRRPLHPRFRQRPYLRGNPRRNPQNLQVNEELVDRYREFHGIEPDHVDEYKFWVPGKLKEVGKCAVDVGYKSHTKKSSKGPHKYVHDFDSGVKVYRKAKKGEKADLTYADGEFPTGLIVCGVNLGFTYKDKNGKLKEIPTRSKKLAGGADTKGHADLLVVVQPSGVQYVIRGGNLEVGDWLRN